VKADSTPHPAAAPATAHHALVVVSLISTGLGVLCAFVAPALIHLIDFFTNLFFYQRLSFSSISPADNQLGLFVIIIPVVGGVIVGLIARFGSKAIRGHGIPEAMEQVMENNSRIPARMTYLKPVSAAISIGSGGPFGAEGPIIATGGALGSLLGQVLSTTAAERKTLLAAGAAAGMSAIFGSPISAVLLAIELLLFEFRARSVIPVALAASAAAGLRVSMEGSEPVFTMPHLAAVSFPALALYSLIGILLGVVAVGVTRVVYWVEDQFERLPLHWMWWPAVGGLAVGVVGYFAPRTLGVGYQNITGILAAGMSVRVVAFLCAMKFVSWAISLGSGTSGGTLAPLLTIGSGAGNLLGALCLRLLPASGLDVRMAGLVGMAALFAGASRALLTSVVFAFETTQQAAGLLPLLAGCSLSFLTARLLMQNSIMTEKIARRGLRIPQDYDADIFQQTSVSEVMERDVKTLAAEGFVTELADRIARHDPGLSVQQAWPLIDSQGVLTGIITRSDLLRALDAPVEHALTLREAGSSPLVVAYPDESVHDAVVRMLSHGIGRLPVVNRAAPEKLTGYLSRTSLLATRLRSHHHETQRDPGWLRTMRERPAADPKQ